MVRRSALLLVCSFGTAVAQPGASGTALGGPLTVMLRSDRMAPSQVVAAMEQEVEAIVASSGIRVTWSTGGEGSQVYNRLAVLHLRGDCSARAPVAAVIPGTSVNGEPLGQTHMVDGEVLPFADVRCDSVRKLIARDLIASPSDQRDELFGRALGRVMAHELYHVLLRTPNHSRAGLARPLQSRADLVSSRDRFAPVVERKLAESIVLEAGDEAPGSGR